MTASTFFRSGSHHLAKARQARFRFACLASALVVAVFSAGLYREAEWATSLLPWPDVRMTYIFLASIGASIAAPTAWAAWRNEPGALDAIAFELTVGAPITGAYFLWLAVDWRDREVAASGIGFLLTGAIAAIVYRHTRTIPIRDPRRLPAVFRGTFAAFCGLLVVLGSLLALQRPNIFPWDIPPQTSTLIGLIFLSAALLFAFIVARPMWAYGEMALAAFLAYDLVLFVPYVDLLRNIDDTAALSSYYGASYSVASAGAGIRETNLIVYLAVLAISSIAAIALFAWGAMGRHPRPATESGD